MTPDEAAMVYAMVCANWGKEPGKAELQAWQLALRRQRADVMLKAVEVVLTDDRPFMPRVGELIAVARKLDGSALPTPEAALGYYMSGDWQAHPAVNAAAKQVQWDRHDPEGGRLAIAEFKRFYEAECDRAERDELRPHRDELTGGMLDELLAPKDDDEDDTDG